MLILSRAVFGIVNWRARRGLAEDAGVWADAGRGTQIGAIKSEQTEKEAGRSATKKLDGLSAEQTATSAAKHAARRTGVRGETYAYWYLRRHGYVMVSRNFTVPGMKGEIDLAGYDGKVLAFVEVKTRAMDKDGAKALPEDAVTPAKKHALARMAKMFMAEWRIPEAICRFDVLAIESRQGQKPVVRLHKDCFGISGR